MGRKGNRRHVKSLSAPNFFGIERKAYAYVAKPSAGRHTGDRCITVNLLLDRLNATKNRSESDRIIKERKVSVNGKRIRDPKYPIGFNDIVEIEGFGRYIISVDKNAKAKPLEYKDGMPRVLKVVGKYKYKNGEIMLRLHDGTIVKGGGAARVNDSVTIDGKGITNIIKMREGAGCFVIDGVHIGTVGKIISIKEGSRTSSRAIEVESPEMSERFETVAENIIVTS